MAILSGKDIYSSKFITADITDAAHKIHYVPIKFPLGDYFLAEINRKVYLFKIEGSRIFTWEKTLAKSFRKLYYDTSHYMPISPSDTKELYDVLTKNHLPKVNKDLFKTFKILGMKEKGDNKDFSPHELKDLIEEISKQADKHPEEVANMTQFLMNLGVDRKIITPVKKIGEFIEGDLMTTNPGFLGEIISHQQRTDIEHRKVTNQPYNVKKPWIMVVFLVMILGVLAFAVYYLWDTGALEDPGAILGGIGGGPTEAEEIMQKYPTPEALQEAIDKGELDFDELPKDIRSMLSSLEEVEATPKT